MDSNYFLAYYNLGSSFRKLKKYKIAKKCFEVFLELIGDDVKYKSDKLEIEEKIIPYLIQKIGEWKKNF